MKRLKNGDRVRVYGYVQVVRPGPQTEVYKAEEYAFLSGHIGTFRRYQEEDWEEGCYAYEVKLLVKDIPHILDGKSLLSTATVSIHERQAVPYKKAARK